MEGTRCSGSGRERHKAAVLHHGPNTMLSWPCGSLSSQRGPMHKQPTLSLLIQHRAEILNKSNQKPQVGTGIVMRYHSKGTNMFEPSSTWKLAFVSAGLHKKVTGHVEHCRGFLWHTNTQNSIKKATQAQGESWTQYWNTWILSQPVTPFPSLEDKGSYHSTTLQTAVLASSTEQSKKKDEQHS